MCLKPILDYAAYSLVPAEGGVYRFIGGFESTDNHTLWIRSDTLTMPIVLDQAQTYLLPMAEGEEDAAFLTARGPAPEKIRWDQVSSLTEGAKVFIGGKAVRIADRLVFISAKDCPLVIIFYDGNDRSLPVRTIQAGRNRNEYWNPITPYSFVLGAFSELSMALYFLSRPIFQYTAITACIALFTPVIPLLPPGVVCTALYQKLWRRARLFRVYRDMLQLPLRYDRRLPNGEPYGAVRCGALPEAVAAGRIPPLIPGEDLLLKSLKNDDWYLFGRLRGDGELPGEPSDPFAPFGAAAGNPAALARGYTRKAYALEIGSWIVLLAGLGLNIFFIAALLRIFGMW